MADIRTHATLTTSLVSYWDFEETSAGTAQVDRRDRHGSNDLTDNNTTASATGKIGNGADFERSNNEYLSISDGSQTGLDITTDRSFNFWFKFEDTSTQSFITKWGANDGFWIDWLNDNTLRFRTSSDGSSAYTSTVSWTPTASTWYMITYTYDMSAGEVKFYVNGSQQGSTQTGHDTTVNNSTETFRVGNNSGSGYLDGLMDELGVWDKILTSTEVSDLYNSGNGLPYSDGADVLNNLTLSTGLVSYWDMEEASGTRYDLHGSNNLTDNNTVTQATGKVGNCASIASANTEYLSITDASQTGLNITGDLSASFWINNTTDNDGVILGKRKASNAQYFIDYRTSPNRLRLSVSDDGTNSDVLEVETTLNTGTWYHVVCNWDASAGEVEFFVNGSSVGTDSGLITSLYGSGNGEFQIGSRDGTASWLNGLIDEVSIWSKILTSTEITALYNSGDGIPYYAPTDVSTDYTLTTSLLSYWEMEDATDATRLDSHGSNDLAISNTVAQGVGVTTTGGAGYSADATNGEQLGITDASQTGLDFTGDFSLSAWVYLDTASTSTTFGIFNRYLSTGNLRGVTIGLVANVDGGGTLGALEVVWATNGTTTNLGAFRGSTVPATGSWYHIAIVVDVSAESAKIYVNGTTETLSRTTVQGTPTSIYDNGRNIYMFTSNETATGDGRLDEYAIWPGRLLNVGEIRALYGYGVPPPYLASATAYTLTVTPASAYLVTGKTVTLSTQRIVTVTAETVTFTGNEVTLLAGETIAVETLAVTFTGQTVGLTRTYILPVVASALTVTGQAVLFGRTYIMPVVVAVITFTGFSTVFRTPTQWTERTLNSSTWTKRNRG